MSIAFIHLSFMSEIKKKLTRFLNWLEMIVLGISQPIVLGLGFDPDGLGLLSSARPLAQRARLHLATETTIN